MTGWAIFSLDRSIPGSNLVMVFYLKWCTYIQIINCWNLCPVFLINKFDNPDQNIIHNKLMVTDSEKKKRWLLFYPC